MSTATLDLDDPRIDWSLSNQCVDFCDTINLPLDETCDYGGDEFNSMSQLDLLAQSVLVDVNGRWLTTTVMDAQPRQNGKGNTTEGRELFGACILGERILHNAHELQTSEEAMQRALDTIEGSEISKLVSKVTTGNGKLAIRFKSHKGQKPGGIFYRARTAGGGRGLQKINMVVFDEAQAILLKQIQAVGPTLAAAKYAQRYFTGSPGERNEYWWDLRIDGITRINSRMLYSEFTGQIITRNRAGEIEFVNPDPNDRKIWLRANPGFVHGRITEEYIEDEQHSLKEKFPIERLGVWLPPANRASKGAVKVSIEDWQGLIKKGSSIPGKHILTLAADANQISATIYAGGWRNDDVAHVEQLIHAKGVAWVDSKLRDLVENNRPEAIGIDMSGASNILLESVKLICHERKIHLFKFSNATQAMACQGLVKKIKANQVATVLATRTIESLDGIQIMSYGDNGWRWHEEEDHMTSPVVAATMAVHLVDTLPKRRSDYDEDDDEYDEEE